MPRTGRPPMAPDDPRRRVADIRVQLTRDEHARLLAAAEHAGVSVSEWVRQRALR